MISPFGCDDARQAGCLAGIVEGTDLAGFVAGHNAPWANAGRVGRAGCFIPSSRDSGAPVCGFAGVSMVAAGHGDFEFSGGGNFGQELLHVSGCELGGSFDTGGLGYFSHWWAFPFG